METQINSQTDPQIPMPPEHRSILPTLITVAAITAVIIFAITSKFDSKNQNQFATETPTSTPEVTEMQNTGPSDIPETPL